MAHLEIKTAQGTKRLKLGGSPVTIGRQPDNALVLPDELTSRHHCVIEPWDGGFRVRDLGSSNGTKLNDEKVTIDLLDNGDVVKIGDIELRFIDPEQLAPRRRSNAPDFSAAIDDDEQDAADAQRIKAALAVLAFHRDSYAASVGHVRRLVKTL